MPLTPVEQEQLRASMAKAQESSSSESLMTEGAMTDASKRREEGLLATPPAKRSPTAPAGYTGEQQEVPWTVVSGLETPGLHPKPSNEIQLPEGVPSLEVWGRTLMSFGRCQPKHVSYAELSESTEERDVDYCKYCLARVKSATGGMKDFAMYLESRRLNSLPPVTQGPVIPGTSSTRYYK